jgi:hypothetical protein
MQSTPNAAHLPRGSKIGAFGYSFQCELRLRQQVACQADAEAVSVVRDIHARALKEARKVTWARPCNPCQRIKSPVSRGIGGDGVLHDVLADGENSQFRFFCGSCAAEEWTASLIKGG